MRFTIFCLTLIFGATVSQALQVGDVVTVSSQNPLVLLGNAKITAIHQNLVTVQAHGEIYNFDNTQAEIKVKGAAKIPTVVITQRTIPIQFDAAQPLRSQPPQRFQSQGILDTNAWTPSHPVSNEQLRKIREDQNAFAQKSMNDAIAKDKAWRTASGK